MDINKLVEFNNAVSLYFKRKHKIVLNPDKIYDKNIVNEEVVYDIVKWKITDELRTIIEELSQNDKISTEDKILQIYEKICNDYVYDDNLISYIKKVDDDKYSLPDWYGRNIDDEWENNRTKHNRRVCFELSRNLAQSLTELLKNNEDYNVCILWNEELTHYFVGLFCSEYSITLDTDDFFNIKDLTRIKTGLTAEGIKIIEDEENKFKTVFDRFNEKRIKFAKSKVENGIQEETKSQNQDYKDFLIKALEILAKENLDSQGIFEYLKEIVDISLGPENREKIWKKIEGKTPESTRYIRCLVVTINNQKFLIDVDKKEIRQFDDNEFLARRTSFIPYKDLSRGGYDYYDGT